MARVTIGMPCHGRPATLGPALASLFAQDFADFTLLIHENPSAEGGIAPIVQALAGNDPRVTYHRHPNNIGIVANFMSVLHAADSEFFLWAADDDIRHPQALSQLVTLLDANPDAALAGFSVELINGGGTPIDWHPGFSRFSRPGQRETALAAFLDEPELLGKANLAYGLFRRAPLLDVFAALGGRFPDCWGPDIVLLAALVARHPLVATDRVLIRKRTSKPSLRPLAKRFPNDYGWPPGEFARFRAELLAAMPDEELRALAADRLDRRQAWLTGWPSMLRRTALRLLRLESAGPTVPPPEARWGQ